MTDFQTLQRDYVNDLVTAAAAVLSSAGTPARPSADAAPLQAPSGLSPALTALINALPYYGDPAWQAAHRGALVNLLEANLPNNGIAAEPGDRGFGYSTSYSYTGPYGGYRDAFFAGVAQTSAASVVAAQILSVAPALNAGWWSNYAVAALTDGVRLTLGSSLDTGALSAALSSAHQGLLPALSASVLGAYSSAYAPTSNALGAITSAGQTAAAAAELSHAITTGQFTANINQAISMGGDSTSAATWFLYNLWVTLKALGADADATIRQAQAAGLAVPSQVGAGSWWTGGYSSWYVPLGGADITPQAAGTITAGMPENETDVFYSMGAPPMPPSYSHSSKTAGNGYSNSLCYWGSLARFQPPSSSCFGAGTLVLMADGSRRPIEQVRSGDAVYTSAGPRKVVLVESPLRAGRVLYRINHLVAYATAAHPFRAADVESGAYRAIDPWALLDGIPTAGPRGVAALRAGSVLRGSDGKREVPVKVDRLSAHAPTTDAELVYDLVLEDWVREQTSYYVGGPELFLAVDAETADPSYDPPSTMAINAALRAALEHSRAHLVDPARQLRHLVGSITAEPLLAAASESAHGAERGAKLELPRVPDENFYLQNGAWDAHASLLEAELVRQHGRRMRRCLSPAGRAPLAAQPGARVAFVAYDLQLIGECPAPAGEAVVLELCLQGFAGPARVLRSVELRATDQSRWHLVADTSVSFDVTLDAEATATLLGTLSWAGAERGHFHVRVLGSGVTPGAAEHFVYDAEGRVIGRVALEERRAPAPALTAGRAPTPQWSTPRATRVALELGRQLGAALGEGMRRSNPQPAS